MGRDDASIDLGVRKHHQNMTLVDGAVILGKLAKHGKENAP